MNQPRLKKHYKETVKKSLMDKYAYKNVHCIPSIKKIVISSGVNSSEETKTRVPEVIAEIAKITGQKPVACNARKSNSNFKVRKGMPVGVCVTLRNNMMYEFFDRLLAVALANIRDFKGLPRKVNQNAYTIGIKDHTIFPEVVVDINKNTLGMNITIVTNAKNEDEARDLLEFMGVPFRPAPSKNLQKAADTVETAA